MYKVFIESGRLNCSYSKMFESFGMQVVDKLDETVSLVCFTGGHDVDPRYYNEQKHRTTFSNTRRDKECFQVFRFCLENDIPMLGICRGSQFLCVANNGSLWQNIDGHTGGSHLALTSDGEVLEVTSTHHQEMKPNGGQILMTASSGKSRSYMSADGIPTTMPATTPTVEAVHWKDTNSIGIQGHPEFFNASEEFIVWTKKQILKLI